MSDRFPFLPFVHDVLQRVEFIPSLITLSVGRAQTVHCFIHRIQGPKCQRKSALGGSTYKWEDNAVAEHLAGHQCMRLQLQPQVPQHSRGHAGTQTQQECTRCIAVNSCLSRTMSQCPLGFHFSGCFREEQGQL